MVRCEKTPGPRTLTSVHCPSANVHCVHSSQCWGIPATKRSGICFPEGIRKEIKPITGNKALGQTPILPPMAKVLEDDLASQ